MTRKGDPFFFTEEFYCTDTCWTDGVRVMSLLNIRSSKTKKQQRSKFCRENISYMGLSVDEKGEKLKHAQNFSSILKQKFFIV